MSTPLVRFSWTSPSPTLSLGHVSTLTLETSLQALEEKENGKQEEDGSGGSGDDDGGSGGDAEAGERPSAASLTDLRLDFDVTEDGDTETGSSVDADDTYAFFVGSRVFKHAEVFKMFSVLILFGSLLACLSFTADVQSPISEPVVVCLLATLSI